MPIAMTIADKVVIVRSIVSHDGICVEGCSSIALRLYPSTSSPWVAQANVRQITRGHAFLHDPVLSEISSGESRRPYATAGDERYACDEKYCFGPRQYPNVTHNVPQPLD